jgi:hypothetical protein
MNGERVEASAHTVNQTHAERLNRANKIGLRLRRRSRILGRAFAAQMMPWGNPCALDPSKEKIVGYQEWKLTDFVLSHCAEMLKNGQVAVSVKELVEIHQRGLREGLIQVGQLILLGIFFPVLTALLGHLFGSRQK